jgi:hypothetical protein
MRFHREIPQRADFAYQCLVGPHKVSGAALNDIRGFFGLVMMKTMPFGCFRDDEGHIYAPVRSLMSPTGTPNPTTFYYQSTRIDGKNLCMDRPRMAAQAQTALPVQTLEGDVCRWRSQPTDAGNPWEVTASSEAMSWREDGLFDIGGRLLGVGMQWYLPGVDWGTYYASQIYEVFGECLGHKVKGIISVDQAYLVEGGAIHYQKDLVVNNNMHVIWWNFATVYKDGTFDVGSFMVGHQNLGYALLQNEKGEVRTTTKIEGVARHRPGSYFADDVRIVLEDNEEWEFLPDPKGEMIDFVGGFVVTAQQEGRWRRVGDTREPSHWFAWGETDRRNGPMRNAKGSDIK